MSNIRPLAVDLPKAFYLKGFKPFAWKPAIIPLRPLTLLFGENSSGKSSILQGLWLIKNLLAANGSLEMDQDGTRICGVDLGPLDAFVSRLDSGAGKPNRDPYLVTGFYLPLEHFRPDWLTDAEWKAARRSWDGDKNEGKIPWWLRPGPAPEVKDPACHGRDGAWLFFTLETFDASEMFISGISLRTPYFSWEYVYGAEDYRLDKETWRKGLEEIGEAVFPQSRLLLEGGRLVVPPETFGPLVKETPKAQACRLWCEGLFKRFGAALGALFDDPVHLGAQRTIPRFEPAVASGAAMTRDESRLWSLLYEDPGILDTLNRDLDRLGVPYRLERGPAVSLDRLVSWVDEWIGSKSAPRGFKDGDKFRKALRSRFTAFSTTCVPKTQVENLAKAAAELAEKHDEQTSWAKLAGFLAARFGAAEAHPGTIQIIDQAMATSVDLQNMGRGLLSVLYTLLLSHLPDPALRAIEEPELHLHPRLQMGIGDALVRGHREGRICIIETHSEHILLRMLRRLRETSETIAPPELRLTCSDIAVVNIHRGPLPPNMIFDKDEGDFSQVKVIPIDSDGFLDPEDWHGGFFGERLEAIGIGGAEE